MSSTRSRASRSSARDAAGVAAVLGRLAGRVRELRGVRGLTQEKAAERAKLDVKHWQDVEGARTNPTVATLVGVAWSLSVKIADLFADVVVAEADRTRRAPARSRIPRGG